MLVRFNGNSSLPSGNNSSNAYVMSVSWAGSDVHGFLLTGQTNAIATYQLPQHYRFLLGNDYGYSKPAFGSTEGQAALVGSEISCWNSTTPGRDSGLWMLVRDGSLVLGTVGAPVKFTASTGSETKGNTGLDLPATPLVDFGRSVPLTKRGTGTLVLSNVVYTLVDGTGDATSKFVWYLGNTDTNLDAGVLRETGTGPSNSIRNMAYFMNGGILGLAADYTGKSGTNAPAGEINVGGFWVYNYSNTGAGFGAYGGKRTVTLSPWSGSKLTWGSSAVASDYFLYNGAPLIFNAPDADGEIVLATTSTNSISLNSAARTITVYDNPATNSDWATLSIPIIDASASAALVKSGNGILNLSATNNNWAGVTSVSNGTLNVNGTLLAGASNLTVYSGATLGGTGTVSRRVQVLSGGTLSAGTPAGTGTLNISSNLVLSTGATLSIKVDATGYDRVNVGGAGSIDLTGVKVDVIPASGSDVTGNYTILTSGSPLLNYTSLGTVTRGYNVRLTAGGTALELRKDSSGLVIRVQ
ncbi:MAG: autotransporter-associated beta strand repeat-containing protein [bacterium]